MKTTIVALPFILSVILASSCARAMAFPPDRGRTQEIQLDGRLNCPYISHRGGTAYLQVAVTTWGFHVQDRRPMNIAVVLDRSGSMAEEGKINNAKAALYSLINQLRGEDILSIVVYDDVIDVLRSAKRVGNDKETLRRLVEEVYPRGWTNLGGGMLEGLQQVERNLGKEYVNRVILLSDGLANRGITDPAELHRIVTRYRAKCISLTTMGVGLDYNENLMVGLSQYGGGNYYFIESSRDLASMLQKEFNKLSSVIAQNASLEVTLGKNVTLRDVIGCEYRMEDGRLRIPVGDLYASDRRELTLELNIPPRQEGWFGGRSSLTVARGRLHYESELVHSDSYPSFTVAVHYTTDAAEVEKNRDWDTQAKADVSVSTRTVERAMKALDEGKQEEAAKELDVARQSLNQSPAAQLNSPAGAAVREQENKIRSYADVVKDSTSDARRMKKSIQYDNYRTQRNK